MTGVRPLLVVGNELQLCLHCIAILSKLDVTHTVFSQYNRLMPSHPHWPSDTRILIRSSAHPLTFNYHPSWVQFDIFIEKNQHQLFKNIAVMCLTESSKSCCNCVKTTAFSISKGSADLQCMKKGRKLGCDREGTKVLECEFADDPYLQIHILKLGSPDTTRCYKPTTGANQLRAV